MRCKGTFFLSILQTFVFFPQNLLELLIIVQMLIDDEYHNKIYHF